MRPIANIHVLSISEFLDSGLIIHMIEYIQSEWRLVLKLGRVEMNW